MYNCVNIGTVSGYDYVGSLYGCWGYSVNCVNYGTVISGGTEKDEWSTPRNCADFGESVYYDGEGDQISIRADGKTLSKSVTVGSLYTGNEVLSVMNYYVCNEYVRNRTDYEEPLYPLCFWEEDESLWRMAVGVVLERDGGYQICQTVDMEGLRELEDLLAVAAGYDENGKMCVVEQNALEKANVFGEIEPGCMFRMQMDTALADTRVFVLDATTCVPQCEMIRVR